MVTATNHNRVAFAKSYLLREPFQRCTGWITPDQSPRPQLVQREAIPIVDGILSMTVADSCVPSRLKSQWYFQVVVGPTAYIPGPTLRVLKTLPSLPFNMCLLYVNTNHISGSQKLLTYRHPSNQTP